MQIILWILAILFIFSVMGAMARGKRMTNDLNEIRVNILKGQNNIFNDIELSYLSRVSNLEKYFSEMLIDVLTRKGHNVNDYIPDNIEVTMAFTNTVSDICQIARKRIDEYKREEELYNQQNFYKSPEIDIYDEIPF